MGCSPENSDLLSRKKSSLGKGKISHMNNYSYNDKDRLLFPNINNINNSAKEYSFKSRKKSISQSPLSHEDIHRRELRIYKSMAK